MGRPKLPKTEKKSNLCITISKEISAKLELVTNNKSAFIEELLKKTLK